MSLSTLRKEEVKSQPIELPHLLAGLSELVEWETFGGLLGVPIRDMDRIKAENSSVNSMVLRLLDHLVNHVKDLSWKKVIKALEKIPKERDLAQKLSKIHLQPQAVDSPQKLQFNSITMKFARLVFNIKETLEKKVDSDDVLSFATTLQVISNPPPVNIRELFDCLQPHYCFMRYKILEVIVFEFIKKTMEEDMENYREALTKWQESTTVQEFKAAVEKEAITEVVDLAPNQCLVVLRLEGEWLKVTLNNLWKLLEYLFGKEVSILTRLRIREISSVLVCLFAPRSKIFSLLSSSSWLVRCGHVSNLGVLSIQFENILLSIPHDDEKNSFTFESGLANAVKSGSLQLIQFLLDLGADPNNESKAYHNLTPLMLAAAKNDTEIMSLLIEYGADVQKFVTPTFAHGVRSSAIHAAIPKKSTEAIKFLLKKGVSPDHNDPGSYATTPLRIATCDLNKDIVSLLIKEGAKVDFKDSDGFSSLAYACNNGLDSMAELLLDVGADPNLEVQRGVTPLMLACYKKYYNIVKMLLQKGACVNTQSALDSDGITALHVASNINDIQLVNILLSVDADINIQDAHGKTPMHNACANGNEELVQCFLLKKPNLNLCDKKGKSPLHAAIDSKNPQVVKTLLKAGADPKIVAGDSGFPPLQWACAVGNEDVIRILLEVPDIDINAAQEKDKSENPLAIAAVAGNIKAVELLLSKEAKMDIEDKNGMTPIFAAAATGELGVVNLLLKHGATTEITKRGETLLSVTPEWRQRDMEILLQNHMKKKNN